MKADLELDGIRSVTGGGQLYAIQSTQLNGARKTLRISKISADHIRTEEKVALFILNNKAFERRHREIYPLDKDRKGFAIYDYDEKQLRRNGDLSKINAGDLALVFGKDRKVKDVFRVAGTRATYAPDVDKHVFVIYGERFGSLNEPMIYSRFITENRLSCAEVDRNNNFTIGMIATMCSACRDQSIEELAANWKEG